MHWTVNHNLLSWRHVDKDRRLQGDHFGGHSWEDTRQYTAAPRQY